MSPTAFLESVLNIAVPGWRGWGRRSWCMKQRRHLSARARRVVWVHDGEKMPWAVWGANHGFFELEWAGRLPYLRAAVPLR
jgi:hypothetical protein